MSEPKKTTYVPKSSAREFGFPSGGSALKLSFRAEEFIQFIREHTNERGYINFTVGKRREVGQHGDTHYVALDTWQPKQGGAPQGGQPQSRPAPTTAPANPQPEEDDVPF